jgi:phosphate/sulfate permease
MFTFATFIAFAMAWAIGAQDVSNALGTSVGAKAVTVQQAIYIAGVCEFVGSLAGGEVAGMISGGILSVDRFTELGHEGVELYSIVMLSTMSGAFLWLAIATYFSLPVSTTHSLVGALVGVGTVTLGMQAVNFTSISAIVASWVTSPLLGGAISYIVFSVIHTQILMAPNPQEAVGRVLPHFYGFTAGTCVVFIARVGPKVVRLTMGKAMLSFLASYGIFTFLASQPALMAQLGALRVGARAAFKKKGRRDKNTNKKRSGGGDYEMVGLESKKLLEKSVPVRRDVDVDADGKNILEDTVGAGSGRGDIGFDGSDGKGGNVLMAGSTSSTRDVEVGGNRNSMANPIESAFGPLMVVTACVVSIAHGSNDVSNAVGPFTAIAHIHSTGQIPNGGAAPIWVLVCGGIGIVAGLGTYGHKVMATIGQKIAKLTFTRGFAAQIGTALTVLCATQVRVCVEMLLLLLLLLLLSIFLTNHTHAHTYPLSTAHAHSSV